MPKNGEIVTPKDIIREDSSNIVDLQSRKIEATARKRTSQYERVIGALHEIDEELEKLESLRRKLEWQKVQLKDQKRALERIMSEDVAAATKPGNGRHRDTLK